MTGVLLFSGTVGVSYGQFYLQCDDMPLELEEAFAGQVNRLCGAAAPGGLFLLTGLRNGDIEVAVELHETEPEVSDDWEDVVEVPFINNCGEPALVELDGGPLDPLRIAPGHYRVRYCARGMDQANDAETNYDDEPIDSYLLQFWPAPSAPDRILRQTSKCGVRAHRPDQGNEPTLDRVNTEIVLPPDEEREWLLGLFKGRYPPQRLRAVATSAGLNGMPDIDLDLTFALGEADDEVHRAVASWAALRALDIAQLTDLPELTPSVSSLRRGGRALAPFDGERGDNALTGRAPETPVKHLPAFEPLPKPSWDAPEEPPIREWNAVAALRWTAEPDSLTAALWVVQQAAMAFGGDLYQTFLSDLRQTFPELSSH